jgi:hypothetical protein
MYVMAMGKKLLLMKVRASLLVSRGSAKYVFIDFSAAAMTCSGIPWFITANNQWETMRPRK